MLNAIVCVSEDWGIGKDGDLLFHIPDDLKRFKEMTAGKVVLMGRETFESLPEKNRPLPDRTNIVLTSNMYFNHEYNHDNLIIKHNLYEVMKELNNYKSCDIFVIGGQSIYVSFLRLCDIVYVTKVHKSVKYDKTFPNLDILDDWKLLPGDNKKHHIDKYDCDYEYLTYQRVYK